MAGIYLAKKASNIYISKASYKHQVSYYDSAIRISRACLSSTAFEGAEGGNPVSEGEGTAPDGTPGVVSSETGKDPVSQGMYEAKQQGLDIDEKATTGATQFVADTEKEGAKKATEVADTIRDKAKKTMDGAWKGAMEANKNIRKTVVGDDDGSKNNNS